VGALNTLVGLLVIYACKWLFHLDDGIANAIGYAVGLSIGFTLNSRWTFDYRGPQFPALVKYVLVAALAYGMNLLTVLTLINSAGVNAYLAQALGIAPYTLTTYLAGKFIVFRAPAEPPRKST
jgi:putative flippase GtrA